MSVSFKIQLHSWLLLATLTCVSLGRIQDIGTTFFAGFFNTGDIQLDVLLQESKGWRTLRQNLQRKKCQENARETLYSSRHVKEQFKLQVAWSSNESCRAINPDWQVYVGCETVRKFDWTAYSVNHYIAFSLLSITYLVVKVFEVEFVTQGRSCIVPGL